MTSPDHHLGRAWRRPVRLFGIPHVASALACLGAGAVPALAQSPVEQVNAFYASVRDDQRSDLVLLPVLADLEEPPIGAQDLKSAMLLPAGSTNWERASEWATGEAQAAVLSALDQVTQGDNYRTAMAFAQPYGPGVPRALIASGMYTELGDPPSLAGARFGWMPKLEQMACLVHVEATRRQAEGDPAGAMDLLTDWVFLARQMADRAFYREARWGYEQMISGFIRIRDIAYTDMRGERTLTLEQLTGAISRLDEAKIIGIDRLAMPRGDRIAAEQLIERVYDRSGNLNPAAFSSAMASIGGAERPLRMFSEAARWSGATEDHVIKPRALFTLESIVADFDARWKLDPFDQRNNTEPVFAQVDGEPRFAVIDAAMDDMTVLQDLRQQLRTEAVGTRTALGVAGYVYQTRNMPPTLAGIRPRWATELEADPYNPNRANNRRPPLEYFVPIRDTQQARPGPHEMNVVAYDSNFSLGLREDQFVIYSVGPNRQKDWARFVSDEPRAVAGDYLIWPPVISLLRIDLEQQGLLD